MSAEQVCRQLSTSKEQGLSEAQIASKLKEFGRNLPSSPPSRWLRKTIGYLFGGFGPILFVASILVFISWKPLGQPPAVANLALGIVLALVFGAQALFAFAQGQYYMATCIIGQSNMTRFLHISSYGIYQYNAASAMYVD